MTIALTCACGARLEIDETFAGKTVNCPDCQKALSIPRPEKPGLQTSGFALASVVLALAGAFTVVGTLLAILFGFLALRDLARRPEEVAGRRYALTGIILGVVFTLLTVIALSPVGLHGLNHLMARAQWAGKLDYSGPEEIVLARRFAITRPSPAWGMLRSEREGEQNVEDLHIPEDLVLVNLDEDAYLVCKIKPSLPAETDIAQVRKEVLAEFAKKDWASLFTGRGTDGQGRLENELAPKTLPPLGAAEITEVRVDKRMAGQVRRFLIRVVKDGTTAYVLLGGSSPSNFAHVEPEIRKAMDSFKFADDR
jgi:hypothetical protein